MKPPRLSVIVPVLNGEDLLPRCLGALELSDLPRTDWELIVVDDGSTDRTREIAEARADRVLQVPDGPRGPGHARNLAGREATGDVLVMVDADVCVHSDVLSRFHRIFAENEDVGAAFGTYDAHPDAPGFISQYRNLYHRYVHLRGAGDTETFWAGCGAVRTRIFQALGGFDVEAFPRPQIEDIELGYRIRDAGYRILLDPAVEAQHLKRWTLRGVVRTDLFDRGVPWMVLLLSRPRNPNLNVGGGERLRTALLGLSLLAALAAMILGMGIFALVALVGLLALVLSNLRLYRWFAGLRGRLFAVRVVPMNLLYYFIAGAAVVIGGIRHLVRKAQSSAIPADSGSAP